MGSTRVARLTALVLLFAGTRAEAGSVDPFTGTYQDSIPIAVPPFRGMEPKLALTYNSGRGNGFVGVGWTVSGFSTIERASPGKGAPKYDASDIFLLDGEELVPCTALGGTHCTKIQKHWRITFDGIKWYLWHKDGTKLTFTAAYGISPGADGTWGTSDDVVWKWALSSAVDTRGNTVTYNWGLNQFGCCWIYPDSVVYNGASVKFYWEPRPDLETRADGAGLETVRGRIKTIDVTVNGTRTRAYKLLYSTSVSTYRSTLVTVQQFGMDASLDASGTVIAGTALPPVTLTFSGVKGAFLKSSLPNPGQWSFDYARPVVGDFNGDGRSDFLRLTNTAWGGTGTAYLANSTRVFTPVDLGSQGSWNIDYARYFVGDFDGDSKSDFLKLANTSGGGTGYTFLSNGDGTFRAPVSLGSPGSWNTDYSKYYIGDFDGDGKSDVLQFTNSAWGGNGYTFLSSGDGTFRAPVSLGSPGGWNTDHSKYYVGDFDGDGKSDVMKFTDTAWGGDGYILLSNGDGTFRLGNWLWPGPWNTDYAQYFVGDFNGDGKSDFLKVTSAAWGGTGTIYLANGNGTFTPVGLGDPGAWNTQCHEAFPGWPCFWVADFNGDGKSDIRKLQGDGYNYLIETIYFSNGDGTMTEEFSYTHTADQGFMGPYGRPALGDFDGDSKVDFMGWTNTAWGGLGEILYSSWRSDFLASIDNGIGGVISIEYEPSSYWSNINSRSIVQTVSSIVVADGAGGSASERWSYAGGYSHAGRREFRGFNFASKKGPGEGPNGEHVETQYWFHQGDDVDVDQNHPSALAGYMQGRIYRKRISYIQGGNQPGTYSETLTTYWPAPRGGGPPYFAPPYEVINRACRYLGPDPAQGSVCGTETRTTYAEFSSLESFGNRVFPYDSYGNLTRENQYGDNADPHDDRTIIRSYSRDYSSKYIVGLKLAESVYVTSAWPADPPSWMLGEQDLLRKTTHLYDGFNSADDCSNSGASDYPTRGDLTKVIEWLNGEQSPETWIGYDAYGNVICVSDPDRRLTRYAYDTSHTFLTSVTNAKDQVTTVEYYGVDGMPADRGLYGQTKKVTDPNLAEAIFEYDAFGRKTKEVRPPVANPLAGKPFAGFTTSTSYFLVGGTDAEGNPIITNRTETTMQEGGSTDGAWFANYFDGLGRTFVAKERGSLTGRIIARQREFNPTGTILKTSLPYEDLPGVIKRWTSFTYDPQGRVTSTENPDGTRTLTCYDDLARSMVTIDANNHRIRKTVDARGNLVSVREYLGTFTSCTTDVGTPYGTTQYEYDALSRLRVAVDAHGTRVETDYDTLGRRRFLSDPDAGNWYYDYSAAGDLISQRDGNSNTIFFEFDELHRPVIKAYPGGTTVSYAYDDPSVAYSKGRLTSMTDGTGKTAYYYDAIGRPWKMGQMIDSVWYTIAVDLDAAGRLSGITYPDGSVVSYAYDADGFLWKVGGASLTYATLSEYNPLGHVGAMTFGNGVRTALSYYDTSNNRLRRIGTETSQATSLLDLAFTYDYVGNISTIVDGLNAAQTQSFRYDELNRLTSANSQAYGSVGYSYDETGNLQSKEGISYTYNAIGVHQVSATSDGRAYEYDSNGNMLSDGIRTIAYDYDNRPVSIVVGGNETLVSYNGNGERVKKQTGHSKATIYVGKLYECTGKTCTRHIFAGDKRVASVSSDKSVRYYHADHLGSTWVVTDQPAPGEVITVTERLMYRPFGDTQADSAPATTHYKFTSQELDAETGLYFYNARYYNPSLGKFLSPDPIAPSLNDPQTLNRYSYVVNNPLRYTDPSGFNVFDDIGDFFSDVWRELTNEGIYVYVGDQGAGVGVGNSRPYYPSERTEPEYVYIVSAAGGATFDEMYTIQSSVNVSPKGGVSQGNAGSSAIVSFAAAAQPRAIFPYGDNASPWQVGWEWLTGTGPRAHYFTDGDPFTEMLRQHKHIQELVRSVAQGSLPPQGAYHYILAGVEGVPKYFEDYSTLLTGGATGNLAVTYLGSYQLKYSLAKGVLEIDVYNRSSIASATHPPIVGYTRWWSTYVGGPLNAFFSSGPLSPTEQHFHFHERVRVP